MLFTDETVYGAIKKAAGKKPVGGYGSKPGSSYGGKPLPKFPSFASSQTGSNKPSTFPKQGGSWRRGQNGNEYVWYRAPTSSEASQIRSAFSQGSQMIQRAFRYLNRNGHDEIFVRYFGSSTLSPNSNVRRVEAELTSTLQVSSSRNNSEWGVANSDGNIGAVQ